MFYLLNFENHQFITCDNASVAEAKIRGFLAAGCSKDSLEVINGFGDESRMPVDVFRALCEEQGLIDNSIVDFMVEREQERNVVAAAGQREKPSIALWGRLGISLNVTPEELKVLKSGDWRKAENLFVDLVLSDRCLMSGDTYFPEEANEKHLKDMEKELSFDLSERPLHDGFERRQEPNIEFESFRASIMEISTGKYLVDEKMGVIVLGAEADRLLLYDAAEAENLLDMLNETSEMSFVLLDELSHIKKRCNSSRLDVVISDAEKLAGPGSLEKEAPTVDLELE